MAANLRTFIIANPTSGAGAVKREWDVIERMLRATLPEYDVAFTKGPGHATLLAREALRAGWEMVVAVGGDGTLNEVVNGFFEKQHVEARYTLEPSGWISAHGSAPQPINPDAVFGLVPMGTGGDFRRTIGLMGGWREAVEALRGDHTRPIDIGQVAYVGQDDDLEARLFLNIASAGLSGDVDDAVNKTSKRFGGRASFLLGTLRAWTGWRNVNIELKLNDVEEIRERLITFVVANGAYFGGGMWVAPGASIFDGAFQLVVIGDMSKRDALRSFSKIYSGTHLDDEKVWRRKVTQLAARPSMPNERVLLDLDGEQPGRLPAHWSIHPGVVRLKI
ncbi:MAG: diacylglycerol kinase family protein [Myxococcota bacterium]